MIVSTPPMLETHKITRYHGMVTGEAILGVCIFPDLCWQARDGVSGRFVPYEEGSAEARKTSLVEFKEEARTVGGRAIVGVDFDFEVINNKLMITASGAAADTVAA
jgi:uncharacterized protein YbjQ (UPF0145 family)